MSVLLWNIRGAGSEPSLLYLKDMIRRHRSVVIGILEPKQNARKIEEFARNIGYHAFFHRDPINSHIWIFWTNIVQLTGFYTTNHCVSFYLQRPGEENIKFTMVYAKCNRVERLLLWQDLREASNTTSPWILGGDFNVVLNLDEKK